MTWRNIFSEASLKEMRLKIKDLEKEDIDMNFSEEDRKKLMNFYRKNDIPLEVLPKTLLATPTEKPESIMVTPAKVVQKTARNPNQRDFEDPKIKKRVKKSGTMNVNMVINEGGSNLKPMMSGNLQGMETMNKIPLNLKENLKGPASTANVKTTLETNIISRKTKESISLEKDNNIGQINSGNMQNNGNLNKNVVEEKKSLNPAKEKEDDILKEKLRNLFGGVKQNSQQMFFYILYKSFKDEMSRQIVKKTLNVANIKTFIFFQERNLIIRKIF